MSDCQILESKEFGALGRPIPHGHFVEFKQTMSAVNYLKELAHNVNPYRPQGCLLVGPPEGGKSFILRKVAKDCVAEFGPIGPREVPVIYMDAPVSGSRKELFRTFADRLNIPLDYRASWDRIRPVIKKGFREAKTRVLLIDELNNVIAGPYQMQRMIIDDLKDISNDVGIPILCAGTREALNAVGRSEQYRSRFRPIGLNTLKMDKTYISILSAFEEAMGIAQGTFASRKPSELIFLNSNQVIGRVVWLLNRALMLATEAKKDRIELEDIERAGYTDLPWIDEAGRPIARGN